MKQCYTRPHAYALRTALLSVLGFGMVLLFAGSAGRLGAQVLDWQLPLTEALPRDAGQAQWGQPAWPEKSPVWGQQFPHALQLYGHAPSQVRQLELAPRLDLHTGFSLELWLLDHVNQPVGCQVALRNPETGRTGAAVAYWNNQAAGLVLPSGKSETVKLMGEAKGWKEYWRHVVLTYDGTELVLYVNGQEKGATMVPQGQVELPAPPLLELVGYFEAEPYMRLPQLVQRLRVENGALNLKQVSDRFATMRAQVEDGVPYDNALHFTAGPYLYALSDSSCQLLVETNRPSGVSLRYGHNRGMARSVSRSGARTHHFTLDGLQPGKPVFYEVTAQAGASQLASGLLTFRTAPAANLDSALAFRFAVLGDTESRPHINQRLSKLIWDERPSFVVNLGDLTDGGKRPNRFQWTHEYFPGVQALAGRTPFLPLPGNGEGDLYWYRHYHQNLPNDAAYYSAQYGDVALFFLNSNEVDELQQGGRQYAWLRDQLAASGANFKLVCLHHTPWSSDDDDHGDSWTEVPRWGDPRLREIGQLCEQGQVNAVLYGHVHAYERSFPLRGGQVVDQAEGVVYVQSGGGGGNLEDFAPYPAPFSAKLFRGHHYLRFERQDNTLDLYLHDDRGALRDHYRFYPRPGLKKQ